MPKITTPQRFAIAFSAFRPQITKSITQIAADSHNGRKPDPVWSGVKTLKINYNNIRNESVLGILGGVYTNYLKAYPSPEEQEDLESWEESARRSKSKTVKQFFGLHFTDIEAASVLVSKIKEEENEEKKLKLQEEFKSKNVGFDVSEYYHGTNATLLNYVWRNEDFSGSDNSKNKIGGESKAVYNAKKQLEWAIEQNREYALNRGEELHAIGWEVRNTHSFVNKDGTLNFSADSMGEESRKNAIEKLGGKKLNLVYFQTPMDPSKPMATNLDMYGIYIDEKKVPLEKQVEAYIALIEGMYKRFPEEGRFSGSKGFADDCLVREKVLQGLLKEPQFQEIKSPEINLDPQLKDKIEKFMMENARKISFYGGDKPDFSSIESLVTEKFENIDKSNISNILKATLNKLSSELLQNNERVQKMQKSFEEIRANPKNLFAKESQVDIKKLKADRECIKNHNLTELRKGKDNSTPPQAVRPSEGGKGEDSKGLAAAASRLVGLEKDKSARGGD